MTDQITVHGRFKSQLFPLTADERQQLEENILAHGIREPLVLWNEILLDGHNRYEIAQAHDLPFQTVSVDLPDEESAADWIDANQSGRRNVTADQMRLIRGRRYNRLKKAQSGFSDRDLSVYQSDTRESTRQKLATEHKVSEATIQRDGKFAEELERKPEILKAVQNGEKASKVKSKLLREKREAEDRRQNSEPNKSGSFTVEVGDCLDKLPKLTESFDCLITDPPYATDVSDIHAFTEAWVPLAFDRLKRTGHAYIFAGRYPDELDAYIKALSATGWHFEMLTWHYRNTIGPDSKQRYRTTYQVCWHCWTDESHPVQTDSKNEKGSVMDFNAPDARFGVRYHAWQKPDDLASMLVRHGCVEGGTLLDPFAGTGTFGFAAQNVGAHALGIELNPDMLDIMRQRGLSIAA